MVCWSKDLLTIFNGKTLSVVNHAVCRAHWNHSKPKVPLFPPS